MDYPPGYQEPPTLDGIWDRVVAADLAAKERHRELKSQFSFGFLLIFAGLGAIIFKLYF